MRHSLFSYPGGRTPVASRIVSRLANTGLRHYREPFAGGTIVGLKMMVERDATVWLNDIDPAIFAVWLAVAHYPELLKQAIMALEPTVANFKMFQAGLVANREIPRSMVETVEMAARKVAVHQWGRSGLGVMAATVNGGIRQQRDRIDSRWNREAICHRIDLLSPHLVRARITCLDFESVLLGGPRSAIYLDPPYLYRGDVLYNYPLSPPDHLRLSRTLKECEHQWFLSINDMAVVRELYSWARIEPVQRFYALSGTHRCELLIYPHPNNRTMIALPRLDETLQLSPLPPTESLEAQEPSPASPARLAR